MYIRFEFQISYCFVAVNKSTNEYVRGLEATKKRVKDKILSMKDVYKESDGWNLSCERCVHLVLGNKTKEWTSKLYYKPDSMEYYAHSDSHFPCRIIEPKFSLNIWRN